MVVFYDHRGISWIYSLLPHLNDNFLLHTAKRFCEILATNQHYFFLQISYHNCKNNFVNFKESNKVLGSKYIYIKDLMLFLIFY